MTRKESQTQSMHKLEHIICACNEAKLRATIDAQEAEIGRLKLKLKILQIAWGLIFGSWLVLFFK